MMIRKRMFGAATLAVALLGSGCTLPDFTRLEPRAGAATTGTATARAATAPRAAPERPQDAAQPATAADVRALEAALRGRVAIAGFTNPQHGEGVAEIVHYAKDGAGYVYRLAGREPAMKTFRWAVRSRTGADGQRYAFIAADGRDDGAAVTFDRERGRLTFSDTGYGPHFAYAIIQDCWPGFMPVRPPVVPVCDAQEDARNLQRLEVEQSAVANLRFRERARTQTASGAPGAQRARVQRAAFRVPAEPGAFTTRPGPIYTTSLGNTVQVTDVRGRTVTFVNQNGDQFTSHALLYAANPRVVGNERVYQAIDSLFPLAVGKKAHAWVYNGDWAWKLEWAVVGRERVSVPAGSFDAYVIEHTETSLGDGYIGKSLTWYAPEIGWNARYRSWVESNPGERPKEWVLTNVRGG